MARIHIGRNTARAIVMHEGRLLLIERWRDGLHYYSIPGGGIEDGETPAQTAQRELLEETGCVVRLGRPLYVLRMNEADHHIFLGQYVSGTPHLPADSPEFLEGTPDNRFEPTWLDLASLADAPFLVWQPIKEQLLHDLAHGFADKPVEIVVAKTE